MKTVTPLAALIAQVTGAVGVDVTRVETIMREEIFHSTLDWQSREQLADGARQAFRLLNANHELFASDLAARMVAFQNMRAESAAN